MAFPSAAAAKKKAAAATHEANQEALDRLWVKYDQVMLIPGSKFGHTMKRAIKSVQACPTAITTVKEAKALHGVGDSLARVICKVSTVASSSSRDKSAGVVSSTAKTTTGRRKPVPPPPPKDGTATTASETTKVSEKQKSYDKAVAASESLVLPSNDWKVVLLVDGREHGWKKVIAKLQMSGVPSEKRQLPIGDMAWVARSGTTEIMLGTIVERKEVNDLASSLFGTRFKEQRLRLQHCGVPQVFFLVEGDTKEVTNCPHETLLMAMMETRVRLGFQVVQTRHLEDSVRFLKSVHRRILQRAFPAAFGPVASSSLPSFASPSASRRKRRRSIQKRGDTHRQSFEEMVFDTPPEPPFGAERFITYDELKAKVEKDREEGTKTLHAIFCGMLKQIPKLSDGTVLPLAHAYPTPNAMFRALEGLNVSEGKSLLADLEAGSKKVGEQKALEVYYTFMAGGDDGFVSNQPATGSSSPLTAEVKKPAAETANESAKPAAKKPYASSKVAAARPVSGNSTQSKPVARPPTQAGLISRHSSAETPSETKERSKQQKPLRVPTDIIELIDDSASENDDVVPSQLSQDSWEQWDEDIILSTNQDKAAVESQPKQAPAALAMESRPRDPADRKSLESIDSLDVEINALRQRKKTARTVSYSSPSFSFSTASDTPVMKAKRPSPALLASAPRKRRSVTSPSFTSADTSDLNQAGQRENMGLSQTSHSTQGSSSFNSPESLAVRIRRLREQVKEAAESVSSPEPRSTVVREVSISEDESMVSPPTSRRAEPEIIDLID